MFKKYKAFFSALIVISILFCLAACGTANSSSDKVKSETENNETSHSKQENVENTTGDMTTTIADKTTDMTITTTSATATTTTTTAKPLTTEKPTTTTQKKNTTKKPLEVGTLSENPNVPVFFQTDYKHIPYGNYGTVSSHGCAIVCISMIASHIKGDGYTPDVLAKQFGNYNTAVGSLWSLFPDSAKKLNIEYGGMTYDEDKVLKALKDGKLVISGQKNSIFSKTGHFILLTGLDKNGKIFVNDPYKPNQNKSEYMVQGFKTGFLQSDVFGTGSPYWIYG